MKKYQNIIISFLLTTLMFVLFLITNKLYPDIDNYNIALIANKLFGVCNSSMHLSNIAWKFFNVLSDIFTKADVFTLFNRIVIFVSFVLLLNCSFRLDKKLIKVFALSGLFFISQAIGIWSANWTVQTAYYLFIGLLFIYAYEDKNIKRIGYIYVLIGCLYRFESCLLFIPFIILLEVYLYLKKHQLNKRLAILLIIFLIAPLTNKLNDCFYDNETEEKYDSERVNILDYSILDYEDSDLKDKGISENTYYFIRSWHLFDTDNINAELLEEIGDSVSVKNVKLTDIHWTLNEIAVAILNNRLVLMSLVIVALMFINIVIGKNRMNIVFSVLAIGGFGLIIYYFSALARAELRIWLSLLFVLMWFILAVFKESKSENRYILIACSAILLGFSIANINNIDFDNVQLAINARADNVSEIEETENLQSDNIYIWDNGAYSCQQEAGKLPSENYVEHNICSGDWYYGHNFYNEFLNEIDMSNPMKSLIEKDNVYYVSVSTDDIVNPYMLEHYGTELKEIGEFYGSSKLWNAE